MAEAIKDEQLFKKREIKGMFEGPILNVLLKLALPICLGQFFQLLYSIVDTIWISRIDLNDPSYVGGTGMIFPLLFLAIAVASGLIIGVSSLVARAVGARDYRVLNRTAESGLIIGLIISLIFIGLGYIFDKKLMNMLGISEGDYYTHALEYFHYLLPCVFFMLLGNVFAGILQGEGLMGKVMKAMIISTLSNIVLDPVFIFLLNMKVKGAGIATVIAQVIAALYIIRIFLAKETLVQVEWKLKNIDIGIIKKIMAVGFPQTVGLMIMAVSFLFFNRLVISIDKFALTSFSLCGRFDQVVLMPIFAIGSSLITMIGQNYGRRNYDRIKNIWKTGLLSAFAIVIPLASLMFVFAPYIFPFFSNVDIVVNYAVLQVRVIIFSFIFTVVGILARSAFQAIGNPIPALIITVLRLVVIALPASYLYVYVFNLGMYGVWFGIITGNFVAAIISFLWIKKYLQKLNINSKSEIAFQKEPVNA